MKPEYMRRVFRFFLLTFAEKQNFMIGKEDMAGDLNYVKDKEPKTLWNKIGPFVKLREYLAKNITPDVYANERGLKTKIMEFFGQDVPKANVDDFSQNLWLRFLNQPNNLKEENGTVRIPDNIKAIISDRINGGWEKMAKKYGKELNSLDKKIIDASAVGKDVSDLEERRTATNKKLKMVEEGMDLLKKARTGEHQVFNEYNFMPDAYGDLTDLSGLSSFTMYRDDRGRMVVKDKYDFYSGDQPLDVGIVTKTLDTIGYPFEILDYVEDKNPNEGDTPDRILLRSVVNSKNDLDKKMEIKPKKKDGGSSKPEIDWNRFRSEYENMERVGKGTHRTMDVEGLGMIYDALYNKGFNQRQIEAVLGNIIEESGGNPYAVADSGEFKGLFQESDKRYPPKEFKKDQERFEGNKRGYINYMIDRFYDHIQDAGKYSIKGTKYNKAIHAVNEFMSEDPNTDYSYPLVYAFEAPSDKKGTYRNRKKVSELISQSYVSRDIDDKQEGKTFVDYALGVKNDLELQDPLVTSRDEAFREARRRGLTEFTWGGKRYNTKMKADGGPTYEYIASKDNMSVGKPGINENISHAVRPNEGIDITEVIAGGVPGIGDVMDIKDMYDSAIDKDAVGMMIAASGLIPFVGGISKKAMNAKRAVKNLTSRDKELLKSFPEYAKPASPLGESWENHKRRLFSGAYRRLTGMDLPSVHGEPDRKILDTKIKNWNDKEVFDDLKYSIGDEYTDDEIRGILEDMDGYGMIAGHIVKAKNADEFVDNFLKNNPGLTKEDLINSIKSHETEHIVHYPDEGATKKNGFDMDKLGDDEELKDYFKDSRFTEMAARGTQIKNYFGLTNDSQIVTPEMLEYAKNNYVKDYGIDNDMTGFFDTIVDYDKAARWITEHASVGLGAYYIGDRIGNPKNEKKRNGGKTMNLSMEKRRFPSRKFMYFYENDKPEPDRDMNKRLRYRYISSKKEPIREKRDFILDDITIDDENIILDDFRIGGSVQDKQRQAYKYFTEERGMSQIQALAIIGNLMAESGMQETTRGDDDTSYGIQQWHKERKGKLFDYSKKKGHSEPSFQDQLEFLADEYEGKTGYSNFLYQSRGKKGPGYYNYSRQDFQDAPGLYDAVVAWNQGAGRPHKSVIRNDVRYNEALKAAKNIGIDVEDVAPTYGQMGFDSSLFEATGLEHPSVESPVQNQPGQEQGLDTEQYMQQQFQSWVETYGKDIAAHITSVIGSRDDKESQSVDDQQRQYRQYMEDSEEEKRRKLISQILPNIQLKIKGVTQVDGAAGGRG